MYKLFWRKAVTAISVLCMLAALTACGDSDKKNSDSSTSSTNVAKKNSGTTGGKVSTGKPKTYEDENKLIKFQYPDTWEEKVGAGMVLIASPVQEKGWKTNVQVEVNPETDSDTIEKILEESASSLKLLKEDVNIQAQGIVKTKTGLSAAQIVYSCSGNGMEFLEKQLIIQAGDKKVVTLTASTIKDLWSKYEPEINMIFDSLEKIK